MISKARLQSSWPRSLELRCSSSITTQIRKNYQQFRKHLPRVQAYFAVKAGADPAIVKTLYDEGASFDVASMPEFQIVYENVKTMPAKQRQDWIWDKIIYANPIKPIETLTELDQYKPLVTFDNLDEIRKDRGARAARGARVAPQGVEHRGDGGAVVASSAQHRVKPLISSSRLIAAGWLSRE